MNRRSPFEMYDKYLISRSVASSPYLSPYSVMSQRSGLTILCILSCLGQAYLSRSSRFKHGRLRAGLLESNSQGFTGHSPLRNIQAYKKVIHLHAEILGCYRASRRPTRPSRFCSYKTKHPLLFRVIFLSLTSARNSIPLPHMCASSFSKLAVEVVKI